MRSFVIAALMTLAFGTSAYAQQCLHGPNEDAAERTRRQLGLSLVRAINTAEANEGMGKAKKYLPLVELGVQLAHGRATGFEPQFTTDGKSYSLILRDVKDPCHFIFATNEMGIIFQGYPIDYDLQPVAKGAAK